MHAYADFQKGKLEYNNLSHKRKVVRIRTYQLSKTVNDRIHCVLVAIGFTGGTSLPEDNIPIMFSEKSLNAKPKQTPANDKIYYTETLNDGKKLVVGWIIDTI